MPKKIPFYIVLVVLLTAQVLGVVGIVGGLSYQSGQHAVEHMANELMIEIDGRVDQHLNDLLGNAQAVNQMNLQEVEAGRLDLNDFQALGHYFYQQCRLFNFVYMNFGGADGSFIGAGRGFRADQFDIAEVSRSNLNALQGYDVDSKGYRLELPHTEVANPQMRDSPWYADAIAAGRAVWSVPYTWKHVSHRVSISSSVPVYGPQQTLLGVLGIDIELSQISQFLQQLKGDRPGSVFIVERSGQLIASSEDATLVHEVEGKATRLSLADSQNPIIQAAVQQLTERYGSLQAITQQALLHFDIPNSPYVSVSPIHNDYDLDWLVVSVVPQAEFLGDVNTSFRRTLTLGGLALLVALGIGLWLAEWVSHSLAQLTQATQDLAAGRPVSLQACTHIEEIAVLSEAFTQMMDTLQEADDFRQTYAQRLEAQVSEKTMELQQTAARLREAQRIARVGSWDLDVYTREVTWSEELFHISGVSPTDSGAIEFDIAEVMDPEDWHILHTAVETAIADRTPYEVEHCIHRPDGTIRYAISRGEAISDDHNRVVRLAGTVADITDHKQAELALQAREDQLQRLASNIWGMIYQYVQRADGAEAFTYISPRCRDIYGLEPEALLADFSPVWAMTHPDDIERVTRANAISAQQLEPFDTEFRLVLPDGTIRWVRAVSQPERQSNGDTVWDGLVLDITRQKLAEQALRQSEAKNRAILAAIPDLMFRVGADGIFREVVTDGPGQEVFFGGQDPIGCSMATLLPPEMLEREQRVLAEALHTGELQVYEQQIQVGDRLLDEEVRVVKSGEDEVLFIVRDISDRKQAERALKASEAKSRAILAAIPDLMFRLDVNGVYREIITPDHHQDLLPGEFDRIGLAVREVLPAEIAEGYHAHIEQVLQTGELQTYEQQVQVAERLVYEEVRIVKSGDDEVLFMIRDISDRKRAEQQLQLLNEELETKVLQRTAALQEREAHYRALVEVMPDLLIWMRADGAYLDLLPDESVRLFNPQMARAGSTIHQVLPADIAEERMGYIQRALQTRKVQHYEYALTVDDERCFEEARIVAINDDQVLVIVRDITARKATEAALRESEARWQLAVEEAGDGLWDWNAESNQVTYSPRWKSMLGYGDDEIGDTLEEWNSRLHPDDAAHCKASLQKHLTGEASIYQSEYRMQCKDGAYRWILDRGKVIEWTEAGQPKRILGTHTDISDRKRSEMALQNLMAGTAAVTGEDFFPILVKHLAEALDVSHAFITQQVGEHIQTLAIWAQGELQSNFSYPLANTPCQQILEHGYFHCADGLDELSTPALDFTAMGVKSGLGVALRDTQEQTMGGIYILNERPIPNAQHAAQVLHVFAVRAATELERQRVTTALEELNRVLEAKVLERTAELQKREAHYRALVDVIPDLLVHLRRDGVLLDFIPGGDIDLLDPERTFIGDSLYEALPTEQAQQRMTYVERAIQTGEVQSYEYELMVADRCRSEEARVIAINEEEALVIVRDISDRKQAEVALQQSEARFQTLVTNMPGMVYRYFPDRSETGAFTYVSSGASDLLGLEVTQILQDANSVWSLIHPEDLPTLQSSVAAAVAVCGPWWWEGRLTTPSGQLKWIQGSSRPQITPEGVAWDGLLIDISDRKFAEQALTQEVARRQALFDTCADGIVVLSQAGQVIEANVSFSAMLGYSSEETTTLSVFDFEAQWSREQLQQDLTDVDVYPQTFETRHRRKDGSTYDVEVTSNFVGWDGQLVKFCVCRDISDRKQAEQARRQSEQRLRLITDSIPGCIAYIDGSQRYRFVNQTYETWFGLRREDILGKTVREVIGEAAYRSCQLQIQQVLAGESVRFENQIPTLQPGVCRHVTGVFVPEINLDSVVQGYYALITDISDRKQAEMALVASEERYHAIFDQVTVGINQAEPTAGAFVSANQAFCDMLGYTETEILTLSYRDLTHPEDLTTHEATYRQLFAGQTPSYLHEKRYRHKAGHYIWVQVSVSPLRDRDGHIISDIAVVVNIEDRKRAEAALRQSELTNRIIIETIPDLLIQMDRQGRYTQMVGSGAAHANDAPMDSEEVTLVEPETYSILSPELYERRLHYANQALDHNCVQVYEQFFDTEGERRYEEVRIAPLNDQDVLVIIRDITERARAEQALHQLNQGLEAIVQQRTAELREREARYRALVEVIPDLLLRIRADGTQLDCFPGASVKLFETQAFQIGRSIFDVAPHAHAQQRMDYIQAALATQTPQVYDYDVTIDGELRSEETRIVAINSEEVLVIVRDITERKQAEKALRESEARWQFALEGSGDGVWDWNIIQDVAFFSSRWKAMLGYAADEIGTNMAVWDRLVHPDDKAYCHQEVDKHFRGEVPIYQVEHRLHCKDGSYKWILARGKVIEWTENGQPQRMIGTHTDITERKLAEETIREQAALLDVTSDAIVVCDLNYHIRYWNQGAERLYGWQTEAVLQKNMPELLRMSSAYVEHCREKLLTLGACQSELEKVTRTGESVTVESRATLIRDDAGQPKFVLLVDTDITEKKRLEAQFYQAQRLESLGRLSSGIAHDLNNVLTPILSMAQLLRITQKSLDSQARDQLKLLEDSAKRGAGLVKQILTFTRGSGAEPSQVVDVISLLQEIIKIARQSFPKSIEVHLEVPENPPASFLATVAADSIHLHQVFMNLCINACDAMPEGGQLGLMVENEHITDGQTNGRERQANRVSTQSPTEQLEDDRHYVVVTIVDTGTGMAPDVRDRMFEPFFTTKEPSKGTGLGLSTALGIIRNYGGFLDVITDVGTGTEVKVYLPTAEGGTVETQPLVAPHRGNNELILVADDDEIVQRSAQSLLENQRYRTLVADDGLVALDLYRRNQDDISLVVLDIMMPNMDGIGLTRRLKSINPDVRIIAVSGLSTNREPVLAAGADRFLEKPYTMDHLLREIQTLMDQP